MENVPPSLVIYWSYIALKYVPIGSWTMAREGAKGTISLHRRQIIMVFGANALEGHCLPSHIIY